MKEYIERNKVLEAFGEEPQIWIDGLDEVQANDDWHVYTGIVKALPAADVVERKRGEWMFGEPDVVGTTVKCSCCGWGRHNVSPSLWRVYPAHQFCGNCGADMRSHQNILCDQTEEGDHAD